MVMNKKLAEAVGARLTVALPEPRVELDHENAWQLLIATILSAQSTDKMINQITPDIFARWPLPKDLAAASQEDVEVVVKRSGFFRNKAKSIRETARIIATEHGGDVPKDFKALLALPGVARKTANLVMGSAFGINTGMIVDTHAARIGQKLGFTEEKKAPKVEKDLCAHFDQDEWTMMSHRLILFGRYVCTAKKPRCVQCPINELCPVRENEPADEWEVRAEKMGQAIAVREPLKADA
jgi:endonuclease-3